MIQGVFFNWRSPKINKYGEKLKYQNWCPPKRYQFCWHLILDILVVDNGGYYVPVVATGGFSDAPGSIYRSILSSCSYYWKIFTTGASYLTTGALCNAPSFLQHLRMCCMSYGAPGRLKRCNLSKAVQSYITCKVIHPGTKSWTFLQTFWVETAVLILFTLHLAFWKATSKSFRRLC